MIERIIPTPVRLNRAPAITSRLERAARCPFGSTTVRDDVPFGWTFVCMIHQLLEGDGLRLADAGSGISLRGLLMPGP
jgi:hypothetical protein